MRHYEITLLIHPDRSGKINSMIEGYTSAIIKSGGKIHRQEDLGRMHLAYPIKKVAKAHYMLLNIECGLEGKAELESKLQFNDAILRHMMLVRKAAPSGPSAMLMNNKEKER